MNDAEITIDQLKTLVESFVTERDWAQFHNPKNLSMALAIEAGELMDLFKWMTPAECEQKMSTDGIRSEAKDELADILIYAIAFANRNKIDITTAVRVKMEKNEKKYPADRFRGHF